MSRNLTVRALAGAVLVAALAGGPCHAETKAQRTDDFIDSIGVNAQFAWDGSDFQDPQGELRALNYLGIHHVRQGIQYSGDPTFVPRLKVLVDGGIRFDTGVANVGEDVAARLPDSLRAIAAVARLGPKSVFSIEGPNELNDPVNAIKFNGEPAGYPNAGVAREIMKAIYVAIHKMPEFAEVKVLNISTSNGVKHWLDYIRRLGNVSDWVDQGNWHAYFGNGSQPAQSIADGVRFAQMSAPGKPVTISESGYFTAYEDNTGWGGVDEKTQAKNTLNLLADAFKQGVSLTYLHNLYEGAENPSLKDIENTFGLFHRDGTAKPVAVAIHNLMTLLMDDATNRRTFNAGRLDYALLNMPPHGETLLLQRASGCFHLLLWNEEPNWNPVTRSETSVTVTPVSVSLPKDDNMIKVFDPLRGVLPVQTLHHARYFQVALVDHPLILTICP